MEYRHVCPSCNSSHIEITGPQGRKVTDKLGSIEITQEEYGIYKCKKCGLYFRSPILDDNELNLHYSNYDYKTLHNDNFFPTEREILKFIKGKGHSSRRLKILDYGCNEGVFLSLFVNDFVCYGYEIDNRVKQIAENRGITMLNSLDGKSKEEKFDYILLIDVFEHLKNPTETIEQLTQLLNKSGKLIISTGYADASGPRKDLANYWYFVNSLQHLCMLGRDYINFLEKKLDLRTVLDRRLSHYDFDIKLRDKLFYYARYQTFLVFQWIARFNGLRKIIEHIPFVNRPLKWTTVPYYPNIHIPTIQKDHIVLVLEKRH